ncbi:hypothetical protein BSU04_00730 [Caballeronia sordidicola]|uniref:Uncharacterized protein n=1 Tax=Caballeronia sordidicola TaxID=196367 RepID=A0A226XAW3_CABSO|nr:hypothetical protein BSU04_00730 [Caballeronia sordidicola]
MQASAARHAATGASSLPAAVCGRMQRANRGSPAANLISRPDNFHPAWFCRVGLNTMSRSAASGLVQGRE